MSDIESPDELAEAIVELVSTLKNVSFANLADEFPEHFNDGNYELRIEAKNITIWQGMSEIGVAAFNLARSKMKILPTSPLTYFIDGRGLTLPIAKQKNRRYERPHWMPCMLDLK